MSTDIFLLGCSLYLIDMFASTVSSEFCELFTVVRSDMRTGTRTALPYAPMSYKAAVHRAHDCQRSLDPMRGRYDYRVGDYS